MDTPITISSGSTNRGNSLNRVLQSLSPTDLHQSPGVITVDSSCEPLPVSWSKNSSGSVSTISNIQKVSSWIKSIEAAQDKNNCLLKEDNAKESELKRLILVRCDFEKTKSYYPPSKNHYKQSSPLISYLHDGEVKRVENKLTRAEKMSGKSSEHSENNKRQLVKRQNRLIDYPSQIGRKYSVEKEVCEVAKLNDEKSDESSDICEVPLSPESRKKELCKYLQLMNPADKKEIFILQNRRSTRVRNLAAMLEKKELERKIKESEEESNSIDRDITLKSLKELDIKLENGNFDRFNERPTESEERENFYFPFPVKHLIENVTDFDNTMQKLVPKYKRTCRLKNIKLPSFKSERRNKRTTRRAELKRKVKNRRSLRKQISYGIQVKTLLSKKKQKPVSLERAKTLRSRGRFKDISLAKVISRKEKELYAKKRRLKKLRRQQEEQKRLRVKVAKKDSQCEIVTVPLSLEEDPVDLENFMDDIIDFNNLSEEHKKCLIESRILSTNPKKNHLPISGSEKGNDSLYIVPPLYGFDTSDVTKAKKMCEAYKNVTIDECKVQLVRYEDVLAKNEKQGETIECEIKKDVSAMEISNETSCKEKQTELNKKLTETEKIRVDNRMNGILRSKTNIPNGISLLEHDYAVTYSDEDEDEDIEDKDVDIKAVPLKNIRIENFPRITLDKLPVHEVDKTVEIKSLHRSLQLRKKKYNSITPDQSFSQEWELEASSKQRQKKQSHSINISDSNGPVLKAFYIDYNLIICQEFLVSFWMQTPLGNVLGSQNMWIPLGETQRLILNNNGIQKDSMEMVIAMETNIAYVELWAKEHKSDIRESPVADIFATVYFWKQRQNGLDKKVLQLENINGFADDVQYSVMKCHPKIIVSWHSTTDSSITKKKTFIHTYELAADYATVSKIHDMEPIDHYVSSLHNIEDCDNLVMGCGENKITLWNLEYGYLVATIELLEIKSPLSTLWVSCDRGFLFAVQQCVDRELRLIAINGINYSWKKLASYNPPEGFDRLRGVCMENGLLLSFYDQGILCWNAETGEPVEESSTEVEIIPSGRYIILLEENQIIVKHAMTHLISMSDES